MTGEAAVVKSAALWAVGVVLGLLAVSYVLRVVGVGSQINLSPEGVVSGVVQ